MLSILIIDDTPDKVVILKNFIFSKFAEIHDSDIDVASTTYEGLNAICRKQYDLVLLDLFIPKRKGEKESPQNAAELLNNLNDLDMVKVPAHILGITRMTEIPDEFKETFSNELWSLLKYGEDSKDWEDRLERKILYLIRTKMQLVNNPDYNYDVAIINALQEKENEMIRSWDDCDWQEVKGIPDENVTYYSAILEKEGRKIRCVTAYADRMGMVATAVLTTKIINYFRPRYVFMTGICAGISSDKANFGDIIVAESVIDGASGKYANKGEEHIFVPDYKMINTPASFLNKIRRLKEDRTLMDKIRNTYRPKVVNPNHILNVLVGPTASVPAVVADKQVIEDLKGQERKLVGLEMEAYGMYYAVDRSVKPQPQIVASLKSATDFADSKKSDDYQLYGAMTSSELLYHIILNELDYGRKKS